MKKYIFLVIALSIGLIAFSAIAAAKSHPNSDKNEIKKTEKSAEEIENDEERLDLPDVESTKEHPSSLFIGPQGQVRIINGELTSIGAATPQIDGLKVWGISLKVNLDRAKFIPSGATISDLKVGDKVNVKGTINKDNGLIEASILHALSVRQRTTDDLFARIRELIIKIRELQQKAGLPLTPLP